MTRKTKKAKRISLKEPQAKRQRQVWIHLGDHKDIPTIAKAIKTAHPGKDADFVPDVMHFLFDAGRQALGLQGA
jgi:hypothetical protein